MKLDSAVFYSNDLNTAIPFYRNMVGLEIHYIQTGRFVSFKLGGGKLGIKQRNEEREIPGHQTVFIEVQDIETVYKNFQAKGVAFSKKLTNEDWAVTFALLDPDGNKLVFVSNTP